MANEYEELTDAQCDEIRRHPGTFNDMLRAWSRAMWSTSCAAERERCAKLIEDHESSGWHGGSGYHAGLKCAARLLRA